jgi:Rrf2 family iron-sulfur cluster assembly transcriptional regulator
VRRVLAQGVPPEAVEHEEDDLIGLSNAARQPCVVGPAEQGWDQACDRRAVECGPNGRGRGFHRVGNLRDDGPMKVSTLGDYAARALLSLALHGSERPTSVKEIAERTTLPQPYLEQILLAVKGAGLVRSKRGVGGGYVLARPAQEITLADIVGAVEGPQLPLSEHPDHCEGHCVLQEVWVCVSEDTRRALERITLADLVERTRVGHKG